jgi:hypothetical protein
VQASAGRIQQRAGDDKRIDLGFLASESALTASVNQALVSCAV